ncbi:hypothetical protein HYDPIDRAFT_117596 [Hydnomerulius pinastri MD-312]|uniref:Peptidase C14 caspase domain-containing protein n=1 Tax=Hydnomerulius pinastri MD-312 TaxID=994086 RepID=A0A0C9VQW5_9AGAM|nr:hypothetical protein HYDPIDRAFT_117596 [Hydnomerulius pinastri MD-312]
MPVIPPMPPPRPSQPPSAPSHQHSSGHHHSHRRTHQHSHSTSTVTTRHVHYADNKLQSNTANGHPSHVSPSNQGHPSLQRAASSQHLQAAMRQPSSGHRQRVHSTGNAVPPRIINVAPSQSHQHIRIHNGHFEYSACTGRKKALLIGINYTGQSRELRGCINDAKSMRRFLTSQWGYHDSDIVMLMDQTTNPRQMPTRKNMIEAMQWLVKDANPHDALFFHYSGHGGQIPDQDGDEVDGFDEVIYPVDYKKAGVIVDDDMHRIMVKPLPRGCRLTAIFDSCHSGTALDLPYIYHSDGRLKGKHISDSARAQKATESDVISFSACRDDQTSADTFQGGVAVGAMSYAFVTALKKKPKQSYQELLRSVREILRENYQQKSQLSSSHPIDTSLQFIL